MIRVAKRADVGAMLAIYAPYVNGSAVSFEYAVPTLEAFEARFEEISGRYPWLVWEEGGQILGYAYANRAFARAAYQWTADVSIYLAPAAQHTGVGHRLYSCLEDILRALGYKKLYALVTSSNAQSCVFHERRGYVCEGMLRKSGFKLGAWHDVNWYALALGEPDAPEGPPRPFDGVIPFEYS